MFPYICFADNFNQVWIFCSYDHEVVKRIIMPFEVKSTRIEQIFITAEFDMFLLVNHFRTKEYELIQIDLDLPRGFVDFT